MENDNRNHAHVGAGKCPVCGHYGSDCIGILTYEPPIRFEPLFRAIAAKLSHLERLGQSFESYSNNFGWTKEHWETIHSRTEDSLDSLLSHLPSGSGIDNGTKLMDSARSDRLEFFVSFHHMNEAGFYDGWTDHRVIVTPSLEHAFELKITGRNRNDIKEYLIQVFDHCLTTPVDTYESERRERLGNERYKRLAELSRENPTVNPAV